MTLYLLHVPLWSAAQFAQQHLQRFFESCCVRPVTSNIMLCYLYLYQKITKDHLSFHQVQFIFFHENLEIFVFRFQNRDIVWMLQERAEQYRNWHQHAFSKTKRSSFNHTGVSFFLTYLKSLNVFIESAWFKHLWKPFLKQADWTTLNPRIL